MTTSAAAVLSLVNRLKFKHFALLVALDDARNVHQAADAINVAQPSASRMLGDIEEAFGFLLFERNARGMHADAARRRRRLPMRGVRSRS